MTPTTVNDRLDSGDFSGLFIEELGWQAAGGSSSLSVETIDGTFAMRRVAHYRGIGIWVGDGIPTKAAQRAIDSAIAKESVEHLVIFTDSVRQLWLWPQSKDAAGAGATRLVPHEYIAGSANEALRQRLGFIRIGIDDEISLLEMKRRLRRAFDSDPVTKKFYREFAKEHGELMASIEGIDPEVEALDLRWYGSILLNRLMFIYFMQRKGFLDDDVDYLRNRLQRIRQVHGPDEFYGFYRDFLLPLFHEGLGSPESRRKVDPKIAEILGDIPYINGGIFAEHELERAYEISIADDVFEKLFDFFDQWQWHLDDRPTGNATEINPDVLGYIFEQFVNNRADNGVYYTKEDVTGYMTSNTLIPVFLERLIERTGVNPWLCLMADPERYIWSSIAHGSECDPPAEIVAEAETWPRPSWDASRPGEDLALPSESWWEVMDRRRYHQDLQERMRTGGIDSVSDAVTANIDLETLAVDVIDRLDNPEDVLVAWNVLTEISVLDPTCGSGAFLFAALKIFEVLYDAVLDAADKHLQTSKHKDLGGLIKRVNEHPNRNYFVLKHATLNNLYGVDLMPEAVEIARLRLFLKLVSHVDDKQEVEPLPDLEFNIKAGNTLVGASTADSVRIAVDIFNESRVDQLVVECRKVASLQEEFSQGQLVREHIDLLRLKLELIERLDALRFTLDEWWRQFLGSHEDLETFREICQPFHWFIEFPEIFASGRFDVIVGNPPYVSKPKLASATLEKFGYSIHGFSTLDCPDIYSQCVERSSTLLAEEGRIAMIVPMNLAWGKEFQSLRRLLGDRFGSIWATTYDQMPSRLFEGVGVRNTIFICGSDDEGLHTSSFNKWTADFRPHLLEIQRYVLLGKEVEPWPKVGSLALAQIATAQRGAFGSACVKKSKYRLGHKKIANYWLSVFLKDPPAMDAHRRPVPQKVVAEIFFGNEEDLFAALAVCSSRTMFLWWVFTADMFNAKSSTFTDFPLNIKHLSESDRDALVDVGKRLNERLSKPGPHWLWTPYAGEWYGNFDLTLCADITDDAENVILRNFGLDASREALEVEYWKYMKSGGERPGTVRGEAPDRDR
jgi:hypothetical protein